MAEIPTCQSSRNDFHQFRAASYSYTSYRRPISFGSIERGWCNHSLLSTLQIERQQWAMGFWLQKGVANEAMTKPVAIEPGSATPSTDRGSSTTCPLSSPSRLSQITGRTVCQMHIALFYYLLAHFCNQLFFADPYQMFGATSSRLASSGIRQWLKALLDRLKNNIDDE